MNVPHAKLLPLIDKRSSPAHHKHHCQHRCTVIVASCFRKIIINFSGLIMIFHTGSNPAVLSQRLIGRVHPAFQFIRSPLSSIIPEQIWFLQIDCAEGEIKNHGEIAIFQRNILLQSVPFDTARFSYGHGIDSSIGPVAHLRQKFSNPRPIQ